MTNSAENSETWELLETTYPFITPWFKVRQDRVRTHLGEEITYTYHEHPGSALIVALTSELQIVLLKHYRQPHRSWCWEIPAGRLESAASAIATAQRELFEEAGGIGREWKYVGKFYTSTGSSSESSEVYLASNVTIRRKSPESTELLHMILVPWREALQMAQSGQIDDGPSALALLLCVPYIQHICEMG